MSERYLHTVEIENPGAEAPAGTRERLRDFFPRSSLRRMTQLGLLIGRVLEAMKPGPEDALVYASAFGESLTLEEYLASFPSPSPTLFQTSIHPSAVQQALIARQRPIGEFFPITGGRRLGAHALLTALAIPARRTIVCGGEERGSWLAESGAASEASFAFALDLSPESAGAIGKVSLGPGADPGEELSLPEMFHHLCERIPFRRAVAPGLHLTLAWF